MPDDTVELRREPSRAETFSFYGRLELLLRGPATFATEVADYCWSQSRPAVNDPGSITTGVLIGGITTTKLGK